MNKNQLLKRLTAGQIRKTALQMLLLRGCDVWINNNFTQRGRKFLGRVGSSDIIGYHRRSGMFVACEVKTKTDFIRPEQTEFLACVKAAGGIAILAMEDTGGNVVLVDLEQ